MPREMLSTNAPLSAAGSAAQRSLPDEDHSSVFVRSTEADRVSPLLRPKLRMVAGGAPIIDRMSNPGGEVLVKDWAEDWAEDDLDSPLDSLGARTEARMDARGSRTPFLTVVENGAGESKAKPASPKNGRIAPRGRGLKKLNSKQIALDWPPTPRGCEWRRSDDGLNLWRCWTDWDDDKTKRIKKSRYAGHLSDDGWRIMKEYDHEAFISIVGERLRRHGGR